MKTIFFEIEDWEADYMRQSLSGHELIFTKEKLDKDHLPPAKDVEAISVFTKSKIDVATIAALPNLKLIATRTTGYDHIDIAEAVKRGITVSSVPSYGENTVAEFAMGLLLCISRRIFKSYDRIRETGSFSLEGLQGFDLKGKTVGVVGTGRIGRHLIKMAKGFDMNIIAYDAFPNEALSAELGFRYVSFEELLSISDVMSFHVPDLPSTRHMINMENINLIKRGAILINTARGTVVETSALVKALNDGILGGAGIDVLEEETPIRDEKEFLLTGRTDEHNLKTILENHLLIDMENVIITPHNAFNTKEALARILQTTSENIVNFTAGAATNVVKQ